MRSSAPRTERESQLVSKVCNLCKVSRTGILGVLTIRAALGSSLIRIILDTFMMMVNGDDYLYGILVFPLGGRATWVITWVYY